MKRRAAGFLNGSIASISYGTNPLFALPLYSAGVGVNSVLFYRYFFAVVIYGLWLKFVKKTSVCPYLKPIFFKYLASKIYKPMPDIAYLKKMQKVFLDLPNVRRIKNPA